MKMLLKEEILRLNCAGFGTPSNLAANQAKSLDSYKVIIANPTTILHLFDNESETLKQIQTAELEGMSSYSLPTDNLPNMLNQALTIRTEELVKFLEAGGLLVYFLCRPFVLKGPHLSLDNYAWLLSLAPDQPADSELRNMSTASHGRNIELTPEAGNSEFRPFLEMTGLEWNTIIRTDYLTEGYTPLAVSGIKKCIAGELYAGDNSGRVVFLPAPYSPDFDRTLIQCINAWHERKVEHSPEDNGFSKEAKKSGEIKVPTSNTFFKPIESEFNSGYSTEFGAVSSVMTKEPPKATESTTTVNSAPRDLNATRELPHKPKTLAAELADLGTRRPSASSLKDTADIYSGKTGRISRNTLLRSSSKRAVKAEKLVKELEEASLPNEIEISLASQKNQNNPTEQNVPTPPAIEATPIEASSVEATPFGASATEPLPVETPMAKSSSTEIPVSEVSAIEVLMAESSSAEVPVAESPVETPSVEAPSVEAPSVETPSVETPSVETPSVETPSVETPSVETPSIEAPSVETLSIETPSIEAPSIEAPSVEFSSDLIPHIVSPETKDSNNWASNYAIVGADQVRQERDKLSAQMKELQSHLEELDTKLERVEEVKNTLLNADGIQLLNACKKVFTALGWTVQASASSDSELNLTFDEKTEVLVRVVRSNEQAKKIDLAGLAESVISFWEENDQEPKGLLVSCTWADIPLSIRPKDDYPEGLVPFAQKKHVCLLTTAQLLGIFSELEFNQASPDEIRQNILKTNGVFEGYALQAYLNP